MLYHEGWGIHTDTIARLIREFLPDNVTVAVKGDDIYAYRKDILKQSTDDIHALSLESKNGKLLGYGADLFEAGTVNVQFKIKGKVVGGFYAPGVTSRTFAKARLKDFTDVLGNDVQVFIDKKEVSLW